MSPGNIDPRVIIQRASWVRAMIQSVRELPLQDKMEFLGNKHHVAAAESYLRRSLEALFDIGRHILVKKFALSPPRNIRRLFRALPNKRSCSRKNPGSCAKWPDIATGWFLFTTKFLLMSCTTSVKTISPNSALFWRVC